MEVIDAILNRRSVRSFLSKPIEEEKLIKVLDCARWAPSAGNVQECRFVVVKEPGAKMQMAEACLGQFWISSAPLIIVVCAKTDIITSVYGEIGKNTFSFMDAALAAQNIMLSAFSEGLGSCIVASFQEDYVKRIVNCPAEVRPIAVIPVGYAAQNPNPPYRKNLESIAFFEKYGKTWVKGVPGMMSPVVLRREENL